jgi:hypothetical protein
VLEDPIDDEWCSIRMSRRGPSDSGKDAYGDVNDQLGARRRPAHGASTGGG